MKYFMVYKEMCLRKFFIYFRIPSYEERLEIALIGLSILLGLLTLTYKKFVIFHVLKCFCYFVTSKHGKLTCTNRKHGPKQHGFK